MKKIKGYVSIILGILLIFTGINFSKGKSFSSIFYHMGLVTILLVCIVSCVGHFNFKGAFFFLHLVNPVLFLLYYMFFIEDDKNFKKILYTRILVIIYMVFDYIIGRVTGHFVYGIFDVNEMNLVLMILIVLMLKSVYIGIPGVNRTYQESK